MLEILTALNTIWKIIFIVFFFGFCVFIHEFGHLLAALWMKLHVEKFSVGFGKRIWGFTYKGVEYGLGWLPFGGFVSLPQLDPTDHPETKDKKPLEPARPWPRAITAFAGPFFNLLFGFFLATIMWGVGVYEAAPATSVIVTSIPKILPEYKNGLSITDRIIAIDGVATDLFLEEICANRSPEDGDFTLTVMHGDEKKEIEYKPEFNPEWKAGLRVGDRIITVNGKKFTKGTTEFLNEYMLSDQPEITLEVIRNGKRENISYTPQKNALMEDLCYPFFKASNPIAVDSVLDDSPAAKVGIKSGDQILAVNGESVFSVKKLSETLASVSDALTIEYSRNGKESTTIPITIQAPLTLHSLGISFAISVESVLAGSPAQVAGIKANDKIISIDGNNFTEPSELTKYVKSTEGRPMAIAISRNGKEILLSGVSTVKMDIDGAETWVIGITMGGSTHKVIAHPNPWTQFTNIFNQTKRTLGLLFAPVKSTITRKPHAQPKVKLQHLSGPLGIVMMLWYSLQSDGLRGGLSLIILISFSLAFMNLLPIPVLDGGHILFAFIEIAIRRRLPTKLLVVIENVFAGLIIILFLYISFFDGKRVVRLFKSGSIKPTPPQKTEKVIEPSALPQTQE